VGSKNFHLVGETPDRSGAAVSRLAPANRQEAPPHFDVYRTDEMKVSSTRFCGGDWHWCLIDAAGRTLVEAGGYRTEERCREAVTILQRRAAFATFSANA
jgi:uncharacterized protein YegP (UPF0339 family)